MNSKFLLKQLLIVACVVFAGGLSARAADASLPSTMVGHWEGNARIIVTWCRQTNLHLALDIASNGTVSGKVGDATLVNGRLTRNRGWLGRKLNLATDYIILGSLTGPIVSAENITRDAVSIPLNFTGTTFAGGLHSSGLKLGAQKHGTLSASHLRLSRVSTNSIPAPSR